MAPIGPKGASAVHPQGIQYVPRGFRLSRSLRASTCQFHRLRAREVTVCNRNRAGSGSLYRGREGDPDGTVGARCQAGAAGIRLGKVSARRNCSDHERRGGVVGHRHRHYPRCARANAVATEVQTGGRERDARTDAVQVCHVRFASRAALL